LTLPFETFAPTVSAMNQSRCYSFLLAILIVPCVCVGQPAELPSNRTEYNFNGRWRLHVGDGNGFQNSDFDDSPWEPVSLPHAWNEDDAFAVEIYEHSTGIAWYRKRFVLPDDSAGRKVFLEFEGVRQAARVYVNSREVGLHENGVMAFGLDITDAVLPAPAENVVAVRTDNDWNYRDRTGQRFQWADRNFNANYGGIPKNVKLHVTDRLYQTLPLYSNLGTLGVYIYADDFDIAVGSAVVHAESEVRNERDRPVTFDYQVVVEGMDGAEVGRFSGTRTTLAPGETTTVSASQRLKNLKFWSWGYGYLYNVYTTLLVDGEPVDTVTTRTGFRKTATRDGMFLLNDRVLQVRGYAQRTSNEWPALGLPTAPWLSDFSNRMMVESGANTVRWMHVTPSKQDVESFDRMGLMMLMPAGDSEGDVRGRRWEQRMELMRDAIIYNRNNPSVVFIEGGNEAISEEHMADVRAIRDQYDPHGGRLAGCREMLDSKIAEWGGEMLYVNKSGDIPLFATEYCRDEGLRKYWDDWSPPFHKDGDGPRYKNESASTYNRNQDSFAIEDVVRWYDYWEARPGTGRRVSAGGLNIIFSDSNTHKRGAESYRRSGEVDPMRIPKDAYFAHRTMWNGWVDGERYGLHIIGHWNYPPETVKPVGVVSTADQVELFLNGKSLGKGEQSSRFLFTFPDVQWQPGTLRAVGYDSEGVQLCAEERVTAGPAAGLRLSHWKHPDGMRADGADLVLVEVEVVDAEGRRCPTAMNMIDFELEGAAEWRGGIAQGRDDNYILATSLPVECGVNRVLVRATTQPGKIRLMARADGLSPATLEFESRPVSVVAGLSVDKPWEGLPSYLELGPTPAGPSYSPTRRPIEIASTSAGSNAEEAALSLDDNELTKWSSGSDRSNAWITYHLKEAQLVDEVCLKLDSWRTASYPIRVLVDGRSVWAGNTPRSLGYVTISFEPERGNSVTVALEGVTSVHDEFGQIVEVTGVVDQSSSTRGRRLAIVEAEVYGPLPAK
jgi:beta-galactosidase